MKKILIISFFAILLVSCSSNKEENIINKTGFNIKENNSIIAEGDNKCFKYVNPEKKVQKVQEKNLMIVAHPDDETIWGGGHLLEDDYMVVCITCGTVDYRTREFESIMAVTNDEYIMLGYPDLTGGYIDNWSDHYDNILDDIKEIVNSRNWNMIVTHNPDGEYGHIHHQMTSSIVSEVSSNDKLYYFGRYYQDGEIPEMSSINNDTYNRKMNELVSIYRSQPKAMARHNHMMPYENFVLSSEW